MSARRAVWEVARREVVERSRSRALRISLVVVMIIAVGGAIAAARLRGHTPTDKIGLVGARSVAVMPAIQLEARNAGRRVRLYRLSSEAAAAQRVRAGTLAVALVDGSRILVKSSRTSAPVQEVRSAVGAQSMFDRLRAAGLSPAQALRVLSAPTVPVDVLERNTRKTVDNQNLALFGVLALFCAVLFTGQAVAQGVTEEKSSRVVELLLTTVSARRLLAGKVLGIGAVGLCFVLLPGVAALAAGSLAGGAGLPSAATKTIALVMVWFVLGYCLFSVAYAAVGAIVSRQEDLATAQLPILLVPMAGILLANVAAAGNPDGTLAQVAAFLPPFSPMLVPVRMVVGHMGWIGLGVAVALDVLATAGLILIAARIYERSVLQTGARVKLAHVLATRPHFDAAEAAYHRADDRGDLEGAFNLGVLLEERGDLEGAEAAYRRADERGDGGGAFNLGILLQQRGELGGAEAPYRRAARSDDPDVASRAAEALQTLTAETSQKRLHVHAKR
jgi:ABC-2 type transport system permease protein